MRKTLTILTLLSSVLAAKSQNIGININGTAPNASALLDIDGTGLPANGQRGLLIPRVALTATNAAAPVTTPATSLLVYNTATAGVVPNNVTPGFYYWGGAAWIRFGTGPTAWTTLGNAGTVAATNFLGTTDNVDFVLRTNNVERLRALGANGRIGIGTTAPTSLLEVNSGAGDAVFGHSTNVGGYLGRETNISFGTPLQTIQGAGLYANNPAAGYTSMYTQSTGAATVAASVNFSDVWIASYNYVQNGLAGFNPSASYSQLNVTNPALGGVQAAFRSYSDRGTAAGNPGFTVGEQATANAQNQDAFAVVGSAFSNSLTRAGGYFESYDYGGLANAYAYVGTAVTGVLRKITGTNAVSEIVPTAEHGRIMLTCPESPEYWYQDYGTVQLVNGHAHVDLDPILADIIMVNDEYPVRVFCTPVDMLAFNGVAQMNRTATGFDLVELNGGTHSGTLDYQLVVKPKTGYGEGRFPQAPGPAWLKKDLEPASARAANQPDPSKVFYWPSDHEVYGYDVDKVTPVGASVAAGPNAGKMKVAEGVIMDHYPAERP